MSGDALSDLLRSVRLRGAVFYYVEGDPPWVAEAPHVREIIPAIMPGAEHMIEFHGVVEGSCYGAIAGEPGVRLDAGDVIMFPQGEPHVMSSDEGMRAPVQKNDLFFSPRPKQLPYTLTMRGADCSFEHFNGRSTGPGSATLACGFLGLDSRPFNPLLASLPRLLKIPGNPWVTTFLGSVVKEARARRPGGEAVLERMTEMLFVEALRRHVDSLPTEQAGAAGYQRDPGRGGPGRGLRERGSLLAGVQARGRGLAGVVAEGEEGRHAGILNPMGATVKMFLRVLVPACFLLLSSGAEAQLPVRANPDHAQLLASPDRHLAANKRLVYDFWREVFEAGHMEKADKYMAESYIQHNPSVPTGRAAFVEFFSKLGKPKPIEPRVKAPLVAIVAEGDLVVLSFVAERNDPKDPAKKYTTTWFDMFRVEKGKIAEHWDPDTKE